MPPMPFQDALAHAPQREDDEGLPESQASNEAQAAEALISLSPGSACQHEVSPLSSYVSLLNTPDLRGFSPWLGGLGNSARMNSSPRVMGSHRGPQPATGWGCDSRMGGRPPPQEPQPESQPEPHVRSVSDVSTAVPGSEPRSEQSPASARSCSSA
jgi:hypothetical protein